MELIDGYNYRAKRVVSYPHDCGSQGHYAALALTGTISAGFTANGSLLTFRWTAPSYVAAIYSVEVTGLRARTAFTAGVIDLNLRLARGWTGPTSGGTLLTYSDADDGKLSTAFGPSLQPEIRVATTATLSSGTLTLASLVPGSIQTFATTAVGNISLPNPFLFKASVADGQAPIMLRQNEGLRVNATVPATGTWDIGFIIKWAELPLGQGVQESP